MNKKVLLFFLILGIILAGVIIAYYPITMKYTNVITAENHNAYGESIRANVNTTISYLIPFYIKWTYNSLDANYINYDIQFSISANLVEDSFNVEVYLKAVRNDNGNYKVIFSKTETRTGLSDGSESFSYSGSYSVATLLETDLGCSQSGSYQIDFYLKFIVTATGSKTGQTLIAQVDYTLFQSLTFDWTPDTVYTPFDPYDTSNWHYWASDSLDPSTAHNYINSEDGDAYYVASDPGDEIFTYWEAIIDTSQDWTPTLILTFKFAGGIEFDITSYQDYYDGLILYDWQRGDYIAIAKPLPTSYTHYEYNLADYTLDWFNPDTGAVHVGFEYFCHDGKLYLDYMQLKLTPYSASWITYFTDYGLIGVLIGAIIALYILKKRR